MNPLQPTLDIQKLAAMVFELSSQLHAERLHRLALEAALAQAGVLDAGAPQKLANDPALREASRREAGESIAGLMRVLTEHRDERAPLRSNDFPA
jgi:hypothetical protein